MKKWYLNPNVFKIIRESLLIMFILLIIYNAFESTKVGILPICIITVGILVLSYVNIRRIYPKQLKYQYAIQYRLKVSHSKERHLVHHPWKTFRIYNTLRGAVDAWDALKDERKWCKKHPSDTKDNTGNLLRRITIVYRIVNLNDNNPE